MLSPKISIIIPIYNAEHSLPKMLNSILKQTFCDFEVLLINDGSTDSSGTICNKYAQKDTRFKAIHQLNAGVSAARQTGLENAQGEYIIHADADDWIEPAMLEELYNKAIKENADVVICDFYTNNGNIEKYVKQQPNGLDHISILHGLLQQAQHKIYRRHKSLRRFTHLDTIISISNKNSLPAQSVLPLCYE